MSAADPRYVAARRVLLDALTALGTQSGAVVVAGAQAVYLNAGDGGLAIAPFTTDADLSLDPSRLAPAPLLEAVMRDAGFELAGTEPGIWHREVEVAGSPIVVPVDLIVPEAFAPPGGRRGARLDPHGRRVARRAVGLEACLVDHRAVSISALDPNDKRVISAQVAGPAALLVAKAHKIEDRLGSSRSDRLVDKDAADIVRLMQSTRPGDVGATLSRLASDPMAGAATRQAMSLLRSQFGRRGRPGVVMASRSLDVALPAPQVEALCVAYTAQLLAFAGGE